MPQDNQLGLTRRSRRVYRSGGDRDDRGWTLLHIGARKGDLKEVKRLLDQGMDVNVAAWGRKSQGVTPLHLAAEGGHVKVMDELLDRGTPLHNAAKERNKQAVKYLVENGAFLPDDMNDTRFNPPLHYCPGLEWAYDELRRPFELSPFFLHRTSPSLATTLTGDPPSATVERTTNFGITRGAQAVDFNCRALIEAKGMLIKVRKLIKKIGYGQ
ncbi:hypothetical protein HYC85_027556 [Camellia sinensis]|uniref:Uncharacterized protein n=1 Tax=Camellia sinensis TaxID=4442 RepID=A0A7J7G727_CAMSI|nr:hypothetical protein HYC85_027556 [Camellia sinensis]